MRTGTKSVLFGYHQFLLHPLMVAIAWTKIYGFPFDPRLWIAFFVHDLGYLGKKNMDDDEGQTHPELGANLMAPFGPKWECFVLYHSRYYSRRVVQPYSALCVADKLAYLLYPDWLIYFLTTLSGELKEYAALGEKRGISKGPRAVIPAWKDESRAWLCQHFLAKAYLAEQQLKNQGGEDDFI